MTILEKIFAYGHKSILCTHNTTIELTKENCLTKRGNCILGINASKACNDLNYGLKKILKKGRKLKITIKTDQFTDTFYGYGNKDLTLMDKNDIVFRKSDFICGRTILINCTKSSRELKRDLIQELRNLHNKFSLTFEIEDAI